MSDELSPSLGVAGPIMKMEPLTPHYSPPPQLHGGGGVIASAVSSPTSPVSVGSSSGGGVMTSLMPAILDHGNAPNGISWRNGSSDAGCAAPVIDDDVGNTSTAAHPFNHYH